MLEQQAWDCEPTISKSIAIVDDIRSDILAQYEVDLYPTIDAISILHNLENRKASANAYLDWARAYNVPMSRYTYNSLWQDATLDIDREWQIEHRQARLFAESLQ